MAKRHKKADLVGPFSGADRIARADKRTRLGRLVVGIRAALIEHVGGEPNAVQQIIIHTATVKLARLVQLDEAIIGRAGLAEDQHQYIAWSNSLRRDLEVLGIDKPAQSIPALSAYINGKAGEAKS